MGSRNRIRSLEIDNTHSNSLGHNHGRQQMRQFSTKSKAKSSASFKGLRRVLTHDGTFESDIPNPRHTNFKKSKSTDTLSRKRAISGLNMTSLMKEKPTHRVSRSQGSSIHSPTHSLSRSTSSGNVAHNLSSALGGGLRPRRTRSTHSVLNLRAAQEFEDNESTTDDEVDHFTDEEEQNIRYIEDSRSRRNKDEGNQKMQNGQLSVIQSSPEDISTVQPSKVGSLNVSKSTLKEYSIDREDSDLINPISRTDSLPQDIDTKFASLRMNDETPKKINDNEDHIGEVDPNTLSIDSHSLVRQERKPRMLKEETEFSNNEDDQIPKVNEDAITENKKVVYDVDQNSDSEEEKYVPDMILSQSTGMERRFDNPPSIQNSLAKVLQNNGTHSSQEKNIEPINNIKGFKNGEMPLPNLKETDLEKNSDSIQENAEQRNNLQNNSDDKHQKSLMNGIFQRDKISLRNKKDSNDNSPSSLRKNLSHTTPSKINNFSQFLKSENIDANSRTQRKMWLQRENSILDLNTQNDSIESIFMTGHIDLKREYERITHEYTTIRRFANPLDEALIRLNSQKKNNNSKSATGTSQMDSSIMSNYNQPKDLEDILPPNQQAKLHAILASIWRVESQSFNKDVNPINKNKNKQEEQNIQHSSIKHSLKNTLGGSGTALHHQRIPKVQPTTRAVHRRMENSNSNLANHFR
ncbi:Target of rapamycin complex 1 subunit TCO89 [Nakaseomyces bracarensis]|uniref:Target of rapamycin complex 1 subunit TCO89 n=1 Tax=Nakaseomyces bracarensis TaxID=273131 RepID=A0ABR4NMT6_9SACH